MPPVDAAEPWLLQAEDGRWFTADDELIRLAFSDVLRQVGGDKKKWKRVLARLVLDGRMRIPVLARFIARLWRAHGIRD